MIAGLKPYAAYKDSGQDWLGRVPKHWTLAPGHSAFCARKESNRGLKEKTVLSLSYGRIKVKSTDKPMGLVPESYETYQIVEPGNIIIRGTDLQNDKTSLRIALARNRGIISSAYLCLAARDTVIPDYGYQILNIFDLTKAIYRYGSGMRQNLDHGEIKRLPIFLPPIDEQAAIVRFLDHANRKIDRFIRTKRKLIALLNEQKQAIIHRAVTRGLDSDVPLKPSGVEWLGDIPAHWELRRAKQLCSRIVDCKNRTPDQVDDGEYVVVRTTNIRHGRFSLRGSYTTDRENFETWTQRGAPRVGDVFFTREAPMGEACLVPELQNLCMGQRMMYMRPDLSELDPEFLLHSIYGPLVRAHIQHVSNGSTVGHLRLGQVGAIPLLWCPIEEQREIVVRIRVESAPLDEAVARIEREVSLMQEYRTRLTADIVAGKLDVRAAAASLPEFVDEPADEAVIDEITDELAYEDAE
jgi:type I restriction enzyme S subunit